MSSQNLYRYCFGMKAKMNACEIDRCDFGVEMGVLMKIQLFREN